MLLLLFTDNLVWTHIDRVVCGVNDPRIGSEIPDITDPATAGVLLVMVLERWPRAALVPAGQRYYVHRVPGAHEMVTGDTWQEAVALALLRILEGE